MLNDICTKCGMGFRRSLLLALMIEAGAQTCDPSECPGNNGGDHDFCPVGEAHGGADTE